jgi:predicted XRE-type DNA-binding protein
VDETILPRTEFGFRTLQRAAQSAVEQSDYSQREIADALGAHESSVSRACSEPGPTFQKLQRRIIEFLTGAQVERRVRFVVRSSE